MHLLAAAERRTGRGRGAGAALILAMIAALALLLGQASPATAAAAPPRDDSVDEPVIMIHGFHERPYLGNPVPWGYDCADWWKSARDAMTAQGWTGELRTYGYYQSDENCDWSYTDDTPDEEKQTKLGDRNTPLTDIARDLAWKIYRSYSSKGKSVDVMAHSMGGLVIRSALTEVSKANPWFPPYLYVEDVVTYGTPHGGTTVSALCGNRFNRFNQCDEMQINSAFLQNQIENPQGAQGTDWTLFGSDFDYIVPAWSATGMKADHKVIYDRSARINHQRFHAVTDGTYGMRYQNAPNTGWTHDDSGAAPVRAGTNSLYWQQAW